MVVFRKVSLSCHIPSIMLMMLLSSVLLCSCTAMPGHLFHRQHSGDKEFKEALSELDDAIELRPESEQRKLGRINSLKTSYGLAHAYSDRFALAKSIIDEYFSYNFDSTLVWLGRCRNLSVEAKKSDDVIWADLKLGEMLAGAGYYMESYDVLENQVDSSSVPESLRSNYFFALYRLSENITNNSLPQQHAAHILPASDYVNILVNLYPEGSNDWLQMRVFQESSRGNFEVAQKLNAQLRDKLDRNSHAYAKAAWNEAVLCDSLGLFPQMILWEARSAKSDFASVVKDYAALNSLSNHLMGTDIDRASRYIQIALEDAVFYNAKLRPWQLSRHIVDIRRAYEQRINRASKVMFRLNIYISVLALLLLAGFFLLLRSNARARRSKAEAEQLAGQLQKANDDIQRKIEDLSDSNNLKDRYIGLFLSQLSENIDKVKSFETHSVKLLRYGKSEQLLQELLASTAVDKEMDAFYDTFDTTFLAIFPNFVEQFNDLLEESARIVPKEGEKLNTELRVFALMRLGIDDSNAIAGLLKYSVRTIYNYKVKARNSSRVPREEFDEMVKRIGG